MATIASRINSSGTYFVNGDFDEWTGAPVVDNSLVLWLDAGQETSYPGNGTTWTSIAATSSTSTLVNGPAYTSDLGGYITFDGVNDYVSFSAPNLSTDVTVATIEMWVKIKGTGSRMPFGFTGYDVYLTGGHIAYNTAASDSYGIPAATVTSLGIVGNWKHLVFVMQNNTNATTNPYTNNKIYVDGVIQSLSQLIGTQSGNTRTFNNGVGVISGWNNNLTQYKALMDVAVFKIHNRELTATEIQKNFNALAPRYNLTPIANVTSQTRTKIDTILASEFDEVTFNNTTPVIKNLLTNSERFEFWGNSLNIVTPNATTAPNGKLTADRIQVNNTGYTAILNIDTVGGASYTFSFYVKSVSGASGTWAVNYYTGAHNRSTVPITGEWTRQYITFTGTGAQVNVYIADNRSLLATLTDAHVWGAQLERGTVPTIYQGIAAANTLVDPGFAKRETSDGNLYVTELFDEVTGMIATNGLLLQYDPGKLESYLQTESQLVDISGNTRNGTINGAVTYDSATNSLLFDSSSFTTNNNISTQANNIDNTIYFNDGDEYTIEFWCKIASDALVTYHSIAGRGTTNPWLGILKNSSSYSLFFRQLGATYFYSTTINVSVFTGWTQVVFSVSANKVVSYYVNHASGTFTDTDTVTNTQFTINRLAAGYSSGGNYYAFDGNVGPIHIYNRALSAAEVANNFEALRNRFGI